MDLFGSLVIAFSMYSRIPMPNTEWTKERMRFPLCFFPLIGVVIGASVYAVFHILTALGFFVFAKTAALALPMALTGGIHMDGFLDVMDAKASHGEREKKLEILKDPHTGAFAIIWAGIYYVLYAAALAELKPAMMPAVCGVYVISRALSGLAVVTFPMAKKSGLAAAFSNQADKRMVAVVMAVWTVLGTGFFWLAGGMAVSVTLFILAFGMYAYYYRMSVKEFGGITGDLAGYFLTVCELLLILGLAVISHWNL